MKIAYLSAILLYSLVKLSLIAIDLLPSKRLTFPADLSTHNSEAILAQGKKLKLSAVDLYDLELIPYISDKLGLAILAKKSEILECAGKHTIERDRTKDKNNKCPKSALELVKGIGSKKALILENYLALE